MKAAIDSTPWSAAAWRRFGLTVSGLNPCYLNASADIAAPGRRGPKRRQAAALQGEARFEVDPIDSRLRARV
jgi:hypothetical protein